jgi:hypothetical protein
LEQQQLDYPLGEDLPAPGTAMEVSWGALAAHGLLLFAPVPPSTAASDDATCATADTHSGGLLHQRA